jgi:hypothetical protein
MIAAEPMAIKIPASFAFEGIHPGREVILPYSSHFFLPQ